jgi:hypothetical protein
MTQAEKIKRTEELYAELQKLWDSHNLSLSVHGVDIIALYDNPHYQCRIGEIAETHRIYRVATNPEIKDLTFFD